MPETPVATITDHFSGLEDPRHDNRRHLLLDIIVVAICAAICDADTWADVELLGEAKEKWFRGFLELPHGIPSHDTFGRVFALLDPEQFQQCFRDWIQAVEERTQGEVIALDGKQLRRSHDKTIGKQAIHMVSAWAEENRLVLGQVKVDDKSNEITAIPQLLDLLEIAGCIVTIDAMGCQKEIANKIVDKGADYVLALKGNQGGLHKNVQELFSYAEETEFVDCDYHNTVEKGHGRIDIRSFSRGRSAIRRARRLSRTCRSPSCSTSSVSVSCQSGGRRRSRKMAALCASTTLVRTPRPAAGQSTNPRERDISR